MSFCESTFPSIPYFGRFPHKQLTTVPHPLSQHGVVTNIDLRRCPSHVFTPPSPSVVYLLLIMEARCPTCSYPPRLQPRHIQRPSPPPSSTWGPLHLVSSSSPNYERNMTGQLTKQVVDESNYALLYIDNNGEFSGIIVCQQDEWWC